MKCFWTLSLIVFCLSAFSQKVETICGEYTYFPPENISLDQAKRTAVERARIEALASKFGTEVSQTTMVSVVNRNDKSDTQYREVGGTEVKGDWLADTKEPEIDIRYEKGMLLVYAKVCGKARERKKADCELSVRILCNGKESESFQNGDRFSIHFKSPVKGFVSLYLIDDNVETAYCLMPYDNGDGKARSVEKSTEYIFLSTQDSLYPYREETILTTDREVDFNRLILVFSPNVFVMPITEAGEYLPELSTEKFYKWLRKNRMKDIDMQVLEKVMEIRKNKNN